MNHIEIEAALNSHKSACNLAASHAIDAHKEAIKRRDHATKNNHGASPTTMATILRSHNEEISEHERMSRVHARRAEWGDQGWFLHSPDEGRDANYMKEHQSLLNAMISSGRVHFTKEHTEALSAAELKELEDEYAAEDEA